MRVAEIEDLLEQTLLRDEAMQYGLYENELEELLDELKSSLAADRDDFIFTVTENRVVSSFSLIPLGSKIAILTRNTLFTAYFALFSASCIDQ